VSLFVCELWVSLCERDLHRYLGAALEAMCKRDSLWVSSFVSCGSLCVKETYKET